MGKHFLPPQKKLATTALVTASKRAIQKVAEVTVDLDGSKTVEKIAKAVSKNTCEDQKNPHNQQRSLRKYTYYQKNSRKLLMNFDYHNYKYVTTMEYQKIPHLDETND